MLSQLEQAEQRWGGSHKLIDQWLENRRNLLVHYCQIAGLPPYEAKGRLPSVAHIKDFCDLLVDYVSEGHFEIYNRVVSDCETNGKSSLAIAKKLLPRIHSTTDTALDFTDKYTGGDDDVVLMQFDGDLSRLGDAMETRFQLEDELLEVLHTKHS